MSLLAGLAILAAGCASALVAACGASPGSSCEDTKDCAPAAADGGIDGALPDHSDGSSGDTSAQDGDASVDANPDAASKDPCAAHNGGCSNDATCTSTGGVAQCSCNANFVGDGVTCAPADLTVAISGAVGVQGNVTVTGPNSFVSTITKTTSWASLAPGDYLLQAVPTRLALPIVDTIHLPSPVSQSVHVAGNGATTVATVNYNVRPGTGSIWLGSYFSDKVLSYAGTDLVPNAAPTPLALSLPAHAGPEQTAIDARGNLWVSDLNSDSISMFAVSDLALSSAAPKVTIPLKSPGDIAFDAHGNMWVSSYYESAVYRFDAGSLTSNSATPSATLSVTNAANVTFDAAGSLWVSSAPAGAAAKTIRIDNPGLLVGTVSSVVSSASIPNGGQIVFDTKGNLWLCTFNNPSTLAMYAAATLSSNNPSPAIAETGLAFGSLAFDNQGALWVALRHVPVDGGAETQLLKFVTPATLPAAGTPTPDSIVHIAAEQFDGARITFDPPATNLPIAQ